MFFFRKVKSDSLKQLEKDFSEYPPFPLGDSVKKNVFNIISVFGLGNTYYTLSRVVIFYIKNSEILDRKGIPSIRDVFYEAKVEYDKLNSLYRQMRLHQKILFLATFFVISPLVILFLSLFAIRMIFKILRRPVLGGDAFGFFSPIFQNEEKIYELVIRPWKILRRSISKEAIISHEHIHLLQFVTFERVHQDQSAVDKYRANYILNELDMDNSYALYLFSLDEIEARLHEVILSYYRSHSVLPIKYNDFIGLIFSNDILCPILLNIVDYNKDYERFVLHDNYESREKEVVKDIAIMLLSFINKDMAARFVFEVLPVVYANLLFMYGDFKMADAYFKTIKSYKLYSELYGEVVFNTI